MFNKASIIVGLVVVAGVGVFVYATKAPIYIPPEELLESVTPTPPGDYTAPTNTPVKAAVTPTPTKIGATPTATRTPTSTPVATPVQSPTPTPTSSGITMAQVAQHSTRTSCWTAINTSVYDLTSWIPQHPGGEQAILNICGKNGTTAYNGEHGGKQNIANILAGYKIGNLSQ